MTTFWKGTNVPISKIRQHSRLTWRLWTDWLGKHIEKGPEREEKALANTRFMMDDVWSHIAMEQRMKKFGVKCI